MDCCLVDLDKRQGVHPVGIREMLRQDLAKLVTRTAGDQAKTVYGNLKLCAVLQSIIEVATHAVGQRQGERELRRRAEEDSDDQA